MCVVCKRAAVQRGAGLYGYARQGKQIYWLGDRQEMHLQDLFPCYTPGGTCPSATYKSKNK